MDQRADGPEGMEPAGIEPATSCVQKLVVDGTQTPPMAKATRHSLGKQRGGGQYAGLRPASRSAHQILSAGAGPPTESPKPAAALASGRSGQGRFGAPGAIAAAIRGQPSATPSGSCQKHPQEGKHAPKRGSRRAPANSSVLGSPRSAGCERCSRFSSKRELLHPTSPGTSCPELRPDQAGRPPAVVCLNRAPASSSARTRPTASQERPGDPLAWVTQFGGGRSQATGRSRRPPS